MEACVVDYGVDIKMGMIVPVSSDILFDGENEAVDEEGI